MNKNNTGGPAFPHGYTHSDYSGMTLRDYIATAVLPAVLAHWAECVIDDQRSQGESMITGLSLAGNEGGAPTGIANDAYAIADAMLKARKA